MEPTATVGAVIMVGHFIVSIFGVQLGNPVIYSLPFKTMEQCATYQTYLPKQVQLDLEWTHNTKSQCFTAVKFQAMMDKQNPQPTKPAGPVNP